MKRAYEKILKHMIANSKRKPPTGLYPYEDTFTRNDIINILKIDELKADKAIAYLASKEYIIDKDWGDVSKLGFVLTDKGSCYFELKKEHWKETFFKTVIPTTIALLALIKAYSENIKSLLSYLLNLL